ncbi:VOC family protein [Actinophytocola sp.]|uniref:VOC family protein n=1 Tax=Actinophytocola sp. TaxID=1872138 RepID=UPI002ED02ED9
MEIDLFAGIPVNDHTAAVAWYEKLFGAPPSFFPHDTEAVWILAEHRSVYVVQRPEHAGHAIHTIMVDDLDRVTSEIAGRGLKPVKEEDYGNGARKSIYLDPDGNEISFGGVG